MNYHQEQLSLLMQNIEDAIWLVNTEMQTLDINPAACRLLGWQASEVIGRCYSAIWPENIGDGHQMLSKYLEEAITLRSKTTFEQGITLSLADNQIILIEGAACPLLDQGNLLGAAAIFRPISPERSIERLQAEFIAMASHNLRTPLMSIQTALDLLEINDDPIKNKQRLVEARLQSQKIALFLQDLFDISQLTLNRKAPINIQSVDIASLVQSVVTNAKNLAPDIIYEFTSPEYFPLILADETKTKIILQNLIAHARDRSRPGDPLKIALEKQPDEVLISVVDNGPSISPQHHKQLFWQIYPLEVNKQNGSMPYGYKMGLFGSRCLVELLGGHMWISQPNNESAQNFRGISVNFTLPIRR